MMKLPKLEENDKVPVLNANQITEESSKSRSTTNIQTITQNKRQEKSQKKEKATAAQVDSDSTGNKLDAHFQIFSFNQFIEHRKTTCRLDLE